MKLCRLIILSVVLFLLGMTAPAYAKITVTVAHTHVETHPQHKAFLVFKNYIENEIGDRYEIQIYPNGLAGSNEQVFSLVKLNSIQCFTAGELFQSVCDIFCTLSVQIRGDL